MTVQLIKAEPAGDKVVASAKSSELKALGWRASCGNMPAAYLTGLLAGTRAKAKGASNAILDIGLNARGSGSRIFAAAKGALDGGLTIPIDKGALPSEERLHGNHIVDYSKTLTQPDAYKKKFAGYLKNNLKPEELQENFSSVRATITTSGESK